MNGLPARASRKLGNMLWSGAREPSGSLSKLPMTEPENLVLTILREVRSNISRIEETMATKADIADVRSEMNSLRADLRSETNSLHADVASDFVGLEKRLSDQIGGLRRAVMEYHSSAMACSFRNSRNGFGASSSI